ERVLVLERDGRESHLVHPRAGGPMGRRPLLLDAQKGNQCCLIRPSPEGGRMQKARNGQTAVTPCN
ncbi:MAG TPA: hypothetical protein VD995_06300, partial [Azospirillum sp.]|nr:hypothetical protein [Azospirillum sp.]